MWEPSDVDHFPIILAISLFVEGVRREIRWPTISDAEVFLGLGVLARLRSSPRRFRTRRYLLASYKGFLIKAKRPIPSELGSLELKTTLTW